ncbi:MAG: helix-turn-helix domain-containing protein [Candidatus Latescibacterota bacterium]|nr:helix-turn-helix domain-containing protein [Candidatus Latescibacterota bacterium]
MTEKSELSISEALRRGREERGESLEQVQQRLGVSLKILEGIEAGQFDVVEPIYARLAVWHYAEHVGLSGDAMDARFEQEIGLPEEPVVMRADQSAPVPVAASPAWVSFLERQPLSRLVGAAILLVAIIVVAIVLLREEAPSQSYQQSDEYLSSPLASEAPQETGSAQEATPDSPGTNREPAQDLDAAQPNTAVAVADAVVPEVTRPPETQTADTQTQDTQAAASGGQTEVVSGQETETPPADALARQVAATGRAGQAPQDDPNPTQAQNPTKVTVAADPALGASPVVLDTADAIVLEARAIDSTWVQVQWDGVDGIEEIIPKGENRHWFANQFFMVRAGRAHGVHFRLQGSLLGAGRLGDATKVLRFRGVTDGYQMLGPELEPLGSFTFLSPDPIAESVDTERP